MAVVIERTARALFGALSPLTGARATGTVEVSLGAGSATLPRNTYLVPVRDGAAREYALFKVAANPATLQTNGEGGDWTVGVVPISVGIVSNLGGKQHNLPLGTPLRFWPPVAGLPEVVRLDSATTGADEGVVKACHFFEDLESPRQAADLFAARLQGFPALVLVWEGSGPADGLTTGMRQGGSRAGRGARFWQETFVLFVVSSRQTSDPTRRSDGLRIMEAATDLLTDLVCTPDGEAVCNVGQLKIASRSREARDASAYIYALRIQVSLLLTYNETRVFSPWDLTRIVEDFPGREAPEPTAPLTVVDLEKAMP